MEESHDLKKYAWSNRGIPPNKISKEIEQEFFYRTRYLWENKSHEQILRECILELTPFLDEISNRPATKI